MWYNPIMLWLLDSPIHGMISKHTMIISFTGRKSGKAYRIPVGYKRVDDALITLSNKQRTWWRNLRGGAAVSLVIQGKETRGWAVVIEDEQGVEDGITAFIGGDRQAASMIDVKMDQDGAPERESLRLAASKRVIVKTGLR